MARPLRQSTSVDVPIGPFLDATDGITAETGLTLTQPDIRLKKNNAAWAQKAAAQTLSHEENGFYEVTLDATDTDTLGLLRLAVFESGACPVWEDFTVVPTNVYDSMFSTDKLEVDVVQFGGSNLTAAAGIPEVKVASIAANAITATSINADAITAAKIADGAIDAATFAAGAITATVIATGAIDADAIADNAIDAGAIAADAITAAKIADGAIDAATFAAGAITAAAIANGAIDAATFAADVDAEILSYIVDDATRIDASDLNSKIDSLTFTQAGHVDANVQRINDVAITGDGQTGTEFSV
jgi:hypothetical protein